MPVIPDLDLSTISTKYEPLPAGEYTATITKVEMGTSKNGHPQVHMVMKVDDPSGDFNGRELHEWLVLRQNDGKPNEISAKQLKRYYEAVLGEERANSSAPDTDDLMNGRVRLVTTIEQDNKGENRDRIKKVFAA